MRIAINCQLLSMNQVGVASYIVSLLDALSDHGSDIYTLLVNYGIDRSILPLKPNFIASYTRLPLDGPMGRILWEQSVMLFALSRQRPNLVHFPDQSMPLLPLPCPSVVTIHDLAPRILPETYARSRFLYQYLMSWIAVHRSTKIIADSESTKRDILRTFRVSPSKIAVITFGPKRVFRPVSSQVQLEQTRRRLGLPQCFILYVGGIDARKNLVRLVEAFDLLRNTQHASVHLLIAGPDYYMHRRVYQRVEELDLADRVHFLGFVAEGDLVHLYNLARVFVLPSLHEGLGFPVLEAMACGVPVVASNLSSLPEVVGDAGILVNPLDTYGLAAAIQKLLVDDVLREKLIKKGVDRAKSFAWDGIVEKLNSVYNEAVNS